MFVKVSIIINTHNSEKFIEQTLMSAINQTLSEIEILVIDHASIDQTIEVVNSFLEKDSRIQIIKSTEKKIVFSYITGEYVCFLGVQDYLDKNFCKTLYQKAKKTSIDIIECCVVQKNRTDHLIKDKIINCSLSNSKIFEYRLLKKMNIYIWGKLFKTTSYKKAMAALIFFEKDHHMHRDDEIQTFFCSYFANSYSSINKNLYYQNPLSSFLQRKACAKDEMHKQYKMIKIMNDFFHKYHLIEQYSQEIKKDLEERLSFIWNILITYPDLSSDPMIHQISTLVGHDLFLNTSNPTPQVVSDNNYRKIADVGYCIKQIVFPLQPIKNSKYIGIVLECISNGGLERVASLQILTLIEHGYTVFLFTCEEIRTDEYFVPKEVHRIILGKDPKQQITALKKYLEEFEIDIVYLYTASLREIYFFMLLKLMGKNAICSYHSYLYSIEAQYDVHFLECLHIMVSLATMITVLSRVDVLALRLKGLQNCIYIPNPLTFDINDQQPLTEKQDPFNILFTGRIEITKGIALLIKALALVREEIPQATLTIVGKSTYQCDYSSEFSMKELIKNLNLKDAVIWQGFHTNPKIFYQKASIFCLPSYMESWSMVYSEAKVCGLPTVISNYHHLELYDETDSLGFEVGNVNDLADKLIYLLKNPDIRQKMGAVAYQNIKKFANQHTLSEFIKPLQSITKNNLTSYIKSKYEKDILNDFDLLIQKMGATELALYKTCKIQHETVFFNPIFSLNFISWLKKASKYILPVRSKHRGYIKVILVKLHSLLPYKKNH